MRSDVVVVGLHTCYKLLMPTELLRLRITFVLSLNVPFNLSRMLLLGFVSKSFKPDVDSGSVLSIVEL